MTVPTHPKLPTIHPKSTTNSHTITPNSSPPSSPKNQNQTATYISPHSPTLLRFSPSSHFPEWKGRCFRCCRTGHGSATCRNLAKYGKCWSDSHVGSRCKLKNVAVNQTLNPAAKPFKSVSRREEGSLEPKFDSLLLGTYPYVHPVMPETRPNKHTCFVDKDETYYQKLLRLQNSVIVHAPFEFDLHIDKLAECIARSNLVQPKVLKVAALARSRFLVKIPEGLVPDTLIKAIPAAVLATDNLERVPRNIAMIAGGLEFTMPL